VTTPHTLIPLRQFRATAPSGGQVIFIQFTNGPKELSFYHGLLTAPEDATFWQAKLRAERGGVDNWAGSVDILTGAGWTVEHIA
jgi:hypothetical protein